MADETAQKTLYIPSDRQKASFFNYEALVGGILTLGPIGVILGAMIGKNKQQREVDTGKKEVNPPGFFNIGTLAGIGIGNLVGIAIGVAAGVVIVGAELATGGSGAAASMLPYAGAIAGSVIGGIAGSMNRKAEMEKEYEEAKQYLAVREHEQGRELSRKQMKEQGVTPQMAAELESKMATKSKDRSVLDRINRGSQEQEAAR